ncbi:hypothetical protein [Nocardiopsis sp. Huas11]|uniref:hypothetical protein n=1 Tax=Nocardiopsis sp. Huas11 TaxID=2183912 RepID=UPI0011C40414|nr:hypothetical protein [Nocardiopsis sp. Huas11]
MIIRNTGMQILTSVLAAAIWSLFALWSMSSDYKVHISLFITAVVGLSMWLSIKIGYWRNIEISEDSLIIRNYLTKSSVPMKQVAVARPSGGMLIIELKGDAGVVKPAAFEGSLISAIFGSPSADRAARMINIKLDQKSGGKSEEAASGKVVHLNLVAFLVIWMAVFLSYLVLHLLFS